MKKLLFILSFALSMQGYSQFSQDFEGTTLPAGWTVLAGGDTAQTWFLADFSLGTPPPAPTHSGTRGMVIQYDAAAHNDILATPAITVTAGVSDNLSFWCRSINPGYPETISIVVSTTTSTAAAFTTVLAANVAPVSGTAFYNYTFPLTAFVGQTIYVGFKSTTTDKDRFDLDDVVVGAIASCSAPTAGLSTVNSTTQATLTWTSTNPAFEVLVQSATASAPLVTAPDGTGVNVTGTSYVASLPNLNSCYVYYVRSECTAGFEYSTWSGPFAFNNVITPNCATLNTPADMATNTPVVLINSVATPTTRNTAVVLSWTAPSACGVAGYRIYFGQTLATLLILNASPAAAVTGVSVPITNVLYNTTYYWKVVPENASGVMAANCPTYSFTTGASPGYCMNGILAPAATYTPTTCDGVTVNTIGTIGAGRYSNVAVTSGQNYKFASSIATDFFSLSKDAGLTATGFGASPYTWTSNYTGVIRVYVHATDQCAPAPATPTRITTVVCGTLFATESFDLSNFKSYPNPVKDFLNLTYDKNITNIAVYNILGQEIISKTINTNETIVDMSNLVSGAYMVKVFSENEVKSIKIIKE